MKLAFCLFNYFPFGGLQKTFYRIAKACQARGHQITVFTMQWQDTLPATWQVNIVPATGYSNHRRCMDFTQKVAAMLAAQAFDCVIGFNRMPTLDIYFAADVCYAHDIEQRYGLWYRCNPRYRTYLTLERRALLAPQLQQILFISNTQQHNYWRYYPNLKTQSTLLPPYLDKGFQALDIANNKQQARVQMRQTLGLGNATKFILLVASSYHTKGVDRAIRALAALPHELQQDVILGIVGADQAKPYQQLAAKLAVRQHLRFLGARDDIKSLLLSADLLLHPSRKDAGGIVLLEAMACATPVLTTSQCGYAEHVTAANAGEVLATPFNQLDCQQRLVQMLTSMQCKTWQQNGYAYLQNPDFFTLPQHVTNIIERIAQQKQNKDAT